MKNTACLAKRLLGSGLFWSILLFATVAVCIGLGVGSALKTVTEQQLTLLETAVRREAVQCYALEGRYPQTLDYLVEQYGLHYDRERYVIHYRTLGGNLLPEISVFYIGD